jgi:hypothetical protein
MMLCAMKLLECQSVAFLWTIQGPSRTLNTLHPAKRVTCWLRTQSVALCSCALLGLRIHHSAVLPPGLHRRRLWRVLHGQRRCGPLITTFALMLASHVASLRLKPWRAWNSAPGTYIPCNHILHVVSNEKSLLGRFVMTALKHEDGLWPVCR